MLCYQQLNLVGAIAAATLSNHSTLRSIRLPIALWLLAIFEVLAAPFPTSYPGRFLFVRSVPAGKRRGSIPISRGGTFRTDGQYTMSLSQRGPFDPGSRLSRLRSSEWEATMVTLHLVNREVPATRQSHLMPLILVSAAAMCWRVIDTSRTPLSIPRRKSPRPCGVARSSDGGPR